MKTIKKLCNFISGLFKLKERLSLTELEAELIENSKEKKTPIFVKSQKNKKKTPRQLKEKKTKFKTIDGRDESIVNSYKRDKLTVAQISKKYDLSPSYIYLILNKNK